MLVAATLKLQTNCASGAKTIAVLLMVVWWATPAGAAQWYTVNAAKNECERASRTDYPTPEDFADYLQKRDRYRNKKVTRDFTGRAQVVTLTDIDNHETAFFVDEETCQRALRRTRDANGLAPRNR
jgi:hypothetical protein